MKAAKSTTLEQGILREIPVPYEPGTMNIAEEVHERVNMLTDFSKRFAGILRESLQFAPLEKLEVLQEYEDHLKSSVKGFNIVLEELSVPNTRNNGHDTLQNNAQRSKFYGQVEGMKKLVHFQGAQLNFGNMILNKMEGVLQKWKSNPTGRGSGEEYSSSSFWKRMEL